MAEFQEWVEEKEAHRLGVLAASREKKRAESEHEAKRRSQSKIAFDRWSADKAVHERARHLFEEVAPYRAKRDVSWREVALALAFVDLYLEERRALAPPGSKEAVGHLDHIADRLSMEKTFTDWSKKLRVFDEVRQGRGQGKRPALDVHEQGGPRPASRRAVRHYTAQPPCHWPRVELCRQTVSAQWSRPIYCCA